MSKNFKLDRFKEIIKKVFIIKQRFDGFIFSWPDDPMGQRLTYFGKYAQTRNIAILTLAPGALWWQRDSFLCVGVKAYKDTVIMTGIL